jgi:hypothetical protein
VALGTLSGAERAGAVAHLTRCRACQDHVAELAAIGDSLLLLAPDDEPSGDLAERVLVETLGVPSRRPARGRPDRGRRVLVGALSAAAVLILGSGLIVALRDDDFGSGAARTALAVEDGGRAICRAVLNETDPAWLFVSLDEPGARSAEYRVELELEEVGWTHVGELEMRDGHGVLAVTLDLEAGEARAVRLVGEGDEAGYEARF